MASILPPLGGEDSTRDEARRGEEWRGEARRGEEGPQPATCSPDQDGASEPPLRSKPKEAVCQKPTLTVDVTLTCCLLEPAEPAVTGENL